MDNFTLVKPNIVSDKILTKEEQTQVDDALKKQGRLLIHPELQPCKNNYIDDYDRGTVGYTTKCKNYSYHKIIIPDGATVKEANFTQRKPNTQAITGKKLTLVGCNLVNNVIDPSWRIESCNTAQIDIESREAEEAAKILAEKEVI